MNDSGYEYTDRDLLEDPETYEYSDIRGIPFLEYYLHDRQQTIETFDERLPDGADSTQGIWTPLLSTLTSPNTGKVGSFLPFISPSSPNPFENSSPGSREEPFDTIAILAALLGYSEEALPEGERATRWLDRFTKQFEVQKRLYGRYTSDMSQIGDKPASILAYPMLSLRALIQYKHSGNMKYANVALKIGDVISSKRDSLTETEVIAFSRLMLDEEQYIVRELLSMRGIPI